MNRRVLVLDVDGTIVSPTNPLVSQRLNDGLKQARCLGWPILFATSRSPGTMLQLDMPKDWHAWAIVCNGAAELDPETGLLSNVSSMSRDLCMQVIRAVDALGGTTGIEVALTDSSTPMHAREVRKVRELPESDWWALKLTVRAEQYLAQELIRMLSVNLEVIPYLTSRDSFSVEVTAPGTGKKRSVARAVKRYGLTAEHCIAFGNSMNDADVLAWAGRSIVVQPAPADLLEIADEVVKSPDEDGVGDYLARLLTSGGEKVEDHQSD